MAQLPDQPALRHDLHPRADAGGARPHPHQAEVAVLKCFEDPAEHGWRPGSKSRMRTAHETDCSSFARARLRARFGAGHVRLARIRVVVKSSAAGISRPGAACGASLLVIRISRPLSVIHRALLE